ncbi:hypothetical protein [Carnobacterium jeotgali]|uniref:hypothetical protein n=1 Tax=Carnobacterium jeotgali TaxID=545534 RepID=UPI003890036B
MNDFLFCLRRNKKANQDVFLFLICSNSGLRLSDIIKLKKKDLIPSKNSRISEKITKRYIGINEDEINETLLNF